MGTNTSFCSVFSVREQPARSFAEGFDRFRKNADIVCCIRFSAWSSGALTNTHPEEILDSAEAFVKE